MARRATPPPPNPPVLTPGQIRRRIERLQRCIDELQAFDPQQVQKRYNITEVVALETSIKDELAAAFGHGTPRFNLYKDAANLDQGPHVMRIGPAFGRGPVPDYDAQEAHQARQYSLRARSDPFSFYGKPSAPLKMKLPIKSPSNRSGRRCR
jgi:hypothetical protein